MPTREKGQTTGPKKSKSKNGEKNEARVTEQRGQIVSKTAANTSDAVKDSTQRRAVKRPHNEEEDEEGRGEVGEEEEEEEKVGKQLRAEIARTKRNISKRRKTTREQQDKSGRAIRWSPSNIIRLLPPQCDIMLRPDAGYNYDGDKSSPDEHPSEKEFEHAERFRKTKVGIATGETTTMVRSKGKVGDKRETPRKGETAFARLTTKNGSYDFCDAFGVFLSQEEIRFDPAFRSSNGILRAVSKMTTSWNRHEEDARPRFERAMRMWRYERRQWELSLIEREWDIGNRKIFGPHFSAETIKIARDYVVEQEARDRDGEIPAHFLGRQSPRDILARREEVGERLDRSSHRQCLQGVIVASGVSD